MIEDMALQVIRTLAAREQTLAVAESCTGGQLAAALTAHPGVSAVFRGGVVAYHNEVKAEVLDIDERILEQYGAVSEQVAREMALGVRYRLEADYGIGVTGIAGPEGGSADKPVGLVYIGWAGPAGGSPTNGTGGQGEPWTNVARFRFRGDRADVQQQSVQMALAGLMQKLGLVEF